MGNIDDYIKIINGKLSEEDLVKMFDFFDKVAKLKEENESFKTANEKLYQENSKLKEELKYRSEAKCSLIGPNYENEQMIMIAEIRDKLRRMEFDQKIQELDQRVKEQKRQKENAEFEIECAIQQKVRLEEDFWSGR